MADALASMDLLDYLNECHTHDDHRSAVLTAIHEAANVGGGLVTAASVRPLIPEWVPAPVVGNVFSQLTKNGTLVHTGGYADSGNLKSRNGGRPMKIYRVTQRTWKEAAA